jgi:transposase-like protein
VVARQYDVNANQVFGWRRRYRGEPSTPSSSPSTRGLVPVTITRELEDQGAAATPAASETIEIDVAGNYRIRVGSSFDPRALGRILDVLSRAGGAREKRR